MLIKPPGSAGEKVTLDQVSFEEQFHQDPQAAIATGKSDLAGKLRETWTNGSEAFAKAFLGESVGEEGFPYARGVRHEEVLVVSGPVSGGNPKITDFSTPRHFGDQYL